MANLSDILNAYNGRKRTSNLEKLRANMTDEDAVTMATALIQASVSAAEEGQFEMADMFIDTGVRLYSGTTLPFMKHLSDFAVARIASKLRGK